MEDVSERKFRKDLVFSHVGVNVAISFDALGDEEGNIGDCQSDYGFSLYADKSCSD